jgi:hypothetical protein
MSIATELPQINIMLRTHPFESRDFYLSFLKDVPLSFSCDQDVNLDLSAAAFVLHSGCQTSLDAYLRGVPSFVFSHANSNVWTSISCALPQLLHKLLDPDFLRASLIRQQQLISDCGLNLYLSNLTADYDYSRCFTLMSIALPSKNWVGLWKTYYFLRRVIGILKALLFNHGKPFLTVIQGAPVNKLSASDIAMYIDVAHNAPVSISHKFIYVTILKDCHYDSVH